MALRPTPEMLQGRYLWNGGPPPTDLSPWCDGESFRTRLGIEGSTEQGQLFDRRNGQDVFGMIAQVADYFGYIQSQDLVRIEAKIAHQLPSHVRTQHDVLQWLIANLD